MKRALEEQIAEKERQKRDAQARRRASEAGPGAQAPYAPAQGLPQGHQDNYMDYNLMQPHIMPGMQAGLQPAMQPGIQAGMQPFLPTNIPYMQPGIVAPGVAMGMPGVGGQGLGLGIGIVQSPGMGQVHQTGLAVQSTFPAGPGAQPGPAPTPVGQEHMKISFEWPTVILELRGSTGKTIA